MSQSTVSLFFDARLLIILFSLLPPQAIGNATGSSAWTESGEQVKKDAASSIKESFNAAPEGGKLGELSDKACPQTGEGVGDQSKQ